MRSLYVFVVDRGEHLQIERTTARCGLTEDEVRSIAQARLAGDRRVAHADHVLRNDDDIRSLRRQLQTTHAQYLESARSTPDAPRTKPLFLLTFGEYLPQFNRPGLCVISYEYPLSERIRTLLRLEDLCERLDYFLGKNEALEHHVSLLLIFEIYEVASRADLKSDLLQELERQKQSLEALRGNPEISEQALENVIQQIDQSASRLYQASGKIGQELRENDWLMSIKQRTNIPGGICEFDLPSYHYWLHLKPEQQRQDLEQWLAPFLPVRDAVDIVLRLLRASGKSSVQVAQQGMYQQMMTGRVAQMVRVRLARGYQCVPEISANKYALNIRFMTQEGMQRPRAAETDVEFELTFCNL